MYIVSGANVESLRFLRLLMDECTIEHEICFTKEHAITAITLQCMQKANRRKLYFEVLPEL